MLGANMKSFIDEMEKIAIKLSPQEERRRDLYFTGLGAASGPVLGGIVNLIQHGKLRPATGIPLKRWVPSTMVHGALLSGALPIARKTIEGYMKNQAKLRAESDIG